MDSNNERKIPLISVVIPIYKAENLIDTLYERLVLSLETITKDFEIILVEDCGGDRSWEKIAALASRDKRVLGIGLARNFGQHHAITAGLDSVSGSWTVVMDCDLQDQPEEIIKLYRKAMEGFDCVLARREIRQDSFFKRASSAIFFRILRYLSDINHDPSISNFGIYSSVVIESVKLFREQFRSFGLMINMVGFKKTSIAVEHAARPDQKSSYSWSRRVQLAVNSIVAYSNKPLVLSIKFGFVGACLSILSVLYLVWSYFAHGIPVSGWTSTIVSIYLVGSIVLMNLGFLGLYVSKVFDEVKRRPLYIVKNAVNLALRGKVD